MVRSLIAAGASAAVLLGLVGSAPAATTTTVAPRAVSPVGLWRTGGYLYRWVAIRGGLEERSMTPHKLKRGCLVRAGDAVDRYYPQSGGLYRVAYRYWKARVGGPGANGLHCTSRWDPPEATVRIVVTATRMSLSCDDEPNHVCYRYTRVGS